VRVVRGAKAADKVPNQVLLLKKEQVAVLDYGGGLLKRDYN